MARPAGGRLHPAGQVSFGLPPANTATLRRLLAAADLGIPRRGLRRVEPVICLTVAGHGRPDGLLRAPVIVAVQVDPHGPGTA